MKYFEITQLNQKVSCLALGVNKTGNKSSSTQENEKARISFCHKAMDMGINFFDTAELYGGGYSEEILGKALQDRRSQAIICTKFNAMNSYKEELRTSLEKSLKRLHTDYIDFYLAHWPNPHVSFEELIGSLNGFKEEGKIRAYGLSNAAAEEIKDFSIKNNHNFFVIENEYNLIEREVEKDILPLSAENSCLFLAYSPLLQGKSMKSNKEIVLLQEKYSCSIQQLFLAWIYKKNVVSIVRTTNESHLFDNVQSLELDLTEEDIKILEAAFKPQKTKIEIDKLQIDNRSYLSLQAAIENEKDLIPSPSLLAERLKRNLNFSPLRVIKTHDGYRISDDFYMSEIKKFWAWKIARKNENKIEAYIFNDL